MGRTVRTVVTIIFVAIVVGVALAVLYLGSLTGLVFGGQATVTGNATAKTPFYAQAGWLKNTAPWPLTIKSITANATETSKATTVYVEPRQTGAAAVAEGKTPAWANSTSGLPYDLVGGSLRYLGFSVTPKSNQVGSFSSITVEFSGPLGFTFHKTFSGAIVAAAAPDLPDGVLATDPDQDSTSLNSYIALLRGALHKKNAAQLAVVMGGNATTADAQALLTAQKAYATKDKLVATATVVGTLQHQRLVFYVTDPTKDALPAINAVWQNFRWNVVRP